MLDGMRIVVYGRSLGGAVAMHLAAEQPDKVHVMLWGCDAVSGSGVWAQPGGELWQCT